MAHTFSQREAAYLVMPASILSADPVDDQDASSLRADASCNGLCYVHIHRVLPDATYLARVAAHPELLPARGYTVLLSEAQVTAQVGRLHALFMRAQAERSTALSIR